jgi:hypothetical protein
MQCRGWIDQPLNPRKGKVMLSIMIGIAFVWVGLVSMSAMLFAKSAVEFAKAKAK